MRLTRLLTSLTLAVSSLLIQSTRAQETWKLEGDQPLYTSIAVAPAPTGFESVHVGDGERTLILRCRDTNRNLQWYCLELPSLKKLNEFPEPAGWNWNVAALGTRYACSFYAGQLRTLDLTTGQFLKPVPMPMPWSLSVLYDKALVTDRGVALALPNMSVVSNHPLVSKAVDAIGPENFLQTANNAKDSWRLDANRWVVSGLIFGADLKPESNYLGAFAWRGLTEGMNRTDRSAKIQSDGKSAATMQIMHDGKVVGQALCNGPSQLPEHLSMQPFGFGYLTIAQEKIVYIATSSTHPSPLPAGDLAKHPLALPILLSPHTDFTPLRWLGQAPQGEQSIISRIQLMTKTENNQLLVKLPDTNFFLNNHQVMKQLMRRVEALATSSPTETWEKVVASYKANNMRWLVPYATSMNVKFSGIPIEMPIQINYSGPSGTEYICQSSVIFDIPEQDLKPFRTADPMPRVGLNVDKTGHEYLQTVASREQAQTFSVETLPLPELPALPTIPTAIAPDSVHGEIQWADRNHPLRLKVMWVNLLLLWVCTVGSVQFMHKLGVNVQFVSAHWALPILVATALVTFDTGTFFLIDYLTEANVGDNQGRLALRGLFKLILYTLFAFIVYSLAIEGTRWQILGIAALAITMSVAIPLLLLFTLFRLF